MDKIKTKHSTAEQDYEGKTVKQVSVSLEVEKRKRAIARHMLRRKRMKERENVLESKNSKKVGAKKAPFHGVEIAPKKGSKLPKKHQSNPQVNSYISDDEWARLNDILDQDPELKRQFILDNGSIEEDSDGNFVLKDKPCESTSHSIPKIKKLLQS